MCMETQQRGLMFGSSYLQKMAAPRLPLVEIPENTRHLQQVSTLSVQRQVILWMIEDEALRGREGLNARTIQQFS
jgi:hypothetical protein